MKSPLIPSVTDFLLLLLTSLTGRAQELTTSVFDGGGGSSGDGTAETETSLGGFAGVQDGAGAVTARAGFPGQIYDTARFAVSPATGTVRELGSLQFLAQLVCDDDSFLTIMDTPVFWSVDSALVTVSADGMVTAGVLPGDAAAMVTATLEDVTGSANLVLRDTIPDNYPPYAEDGLPDDWQIFYFGENSGDAGPSADPDADGQNNHTEYLAGTHPLDAASLLSLRFAGNPAAGVKVLQFDPFLPGRSYTLEASQPLDASGWTALPGSPAQGPSPGEGQILDTAASEDRKFYRLRITVP